MRERSIYLKLMADMEAAHRALDKVDARVHELLDEYDRQQAEKIGKDVEKDLDL